MTAAMIGSLIAGPVSGSIMRYLDGSLGLHGWQWLFLVQGVPASVLGIVAFLYLKDKPEQAAWLDASERESLRSHLDNDAHVVQTAPHGSLWELLRDLKV